MKLWFMKFIGICLGSVLPLAVTAGESWYFDGHAGIAHGNVSAETVIGLDLSDFDTSPELNLGLDLTNGRHIFSLDSYYFTGEGEVRYDLDYTSLMLGYQRMIRRLTLGLSFGWAQLDETYSLLHITNTTQFYTRRSEKDVTMAYGVHLGLQLSKRFALGLNYREGEEKGHEYWDRVSWLDMTRFQMTYRFKGIGKFR